jgi:prepilin-type N-terminal cleavage/methylation domain-containing protein
MKSRGFTLIELIVVIFIIGLLSSVLFLGRTKGEERLALQRVAYQLAQDLREVQEMAMGAGEVNCGGEISSSFGVNFNLNRSSTSYLLFGDCDSDRVYNQDNDILLRQVELEENVQIQNLSPSPNVLNIVFVPPDPIIFINEENWNKEGVVTFSLNSSIKRVKINSAGRIEIE